MLGHPVLLKGISTAPTGDTGGLALTSKSAEMFPVATACAGVLQKLRPFSGWRRAIPLTVKAGAYLCIIIDQSQNSHVPCEKMLPISALYCADTARQIHCRTAIWTLEGRLPS